MKKLLLYCSIALVTVPAQITSATVVDRAIMPLDLSAMPLVSRSLAEFNAESSGSVEAEAAAVEHHSSSFSYQKDSSNAGWLFTSLSEPFYLSLLGAVLLLLGTIKRRNH